MEKVMNKAVPVNNTVFTFTGPDGEIFARFSIDPTDPRLLKRAAKIGEYFTNLSVNKKSISEQEEMIEQKFCELLGYDCKKDLFGRFAAVSVMGDGRWFAIHVVEALSEHLGPEIRRRREERIRKYTEKYTEGKAE